MENQTQFLYSGIIYAVIADNAVEVSRNSETKPEVVIPDSVEHDGIIYRVTRIGNAAFYGNKKITYAVLPDSVTEIGESVFGYCESLVKVNIPEGVETIAYETFCGCENLQSLFIPDSVRSVEERSLWYCRALKTLSIPKHLLGIEYPKILPKRASNGGQCRGMDNLKHCFVRMTSGEIEEFDLD